MPALSFTVFTRKHGAVTFTSPFTTDQALAVIHDLTTNSFAQSLYAKRAHLSDAQAAWVHKLAVDATAPRAEASPAVQQVKVSAIVEVFEHAAKHLKYPRIALQVEGEKVLLKRCGSMSKTPGAIAICTREAYLGKITLDGALTLKPSASPAIREAILKFAADPRAAALEYGQQTGACCFCGLTLTDARSVAVGYGPICAAKWGLPWDHTPELQAMLTDKLQAQVNKLVASGVDIGTLTAALEAAGTTTR